MSRDAITSIAIVGGTHGNELAGVYLVDHWQNNRHLVHRSSFSTELVVANTKAISQNKRYTDCDLNRQFATRNLNDMSLTNYEQCRAKALNLQLGPKGQGGKDLIIDLHNTTSNMGPTLLIPQQGAFYDLMALYVAKHMPEAVIFLDEEQKPNDEHGLLCTVGRYGVIVEVGPVPQGVLKHKVNEQMATMTQLILDFVELYNTDALPDLPDQVDAFRYTETLTLPVDSFGKRIGMVHKHIEGNDFMALQPGDPLFARFDGSIDYYQGNQVAYPCFINEAAYYDNNLAMSLCEKAVIARPSR